MASGGLLYANPDKAVISVVTTTVNVVLAGCTAHIIKENRFAVGFCFSACFLLGSLFNPFTAVVGGVVGAIGGLLGNAKLSQPSAEMPLDS